MANKHSSQRRRSIAPHVFALGALSIVASFAAGIRTAGDVNSIEPTEAEGIVLAGDVNLDGTVNQRDAIDVLEIVRGYKEPSARQLLADPNADGVLTIDDALRILNELPPR